MLLLNTLLDEFLKTDSLPAAPPVLPGDGVTPVIQMLRKLGQGATKRLKDAVSAGESD